MFQQKVDLLEEDVDFPIENVEIFKLMLVYKRGKTFQKKVGGP